MKKDAPVPGQGDIEFILDGKTETLRPSLKACIGVSRLHQSPQVTASKISELEFDSITHVAALGLGVKVDKPFQEKIYRTGLFNLAPFMIKFIRVVNNGGKLDEDEIANTDEDKDGEGKDGEEGQGDEGNSPL